MPSPAEQPPLGELVVVESTARFSPCGLYRYSLTRRWADGPTVAFVGLNPSTADEYADDPTIRRCVGFAKRWGYGRLVMLNLYAYRATDPRELHEAPGAGADSRGEFVGGWDINLQVVQAHASMSKLIVCAWGADPGPLAARTAEVLGRVAHSGREVVALALTKHGQPRHPLYVRGDVEPIPYPKEPV